MKTFTTTTKRLNSTKGILRTIFILISIDTRVHDDQILRPVLKKLMLRTLPTDSSATRFGLKLILYFMYGTNHAHDRAVVKPGQSELTLRIVRLLLLSYKTQAKPGLLHEAESLLATVEEQQQLRGEGEDPNLAQLRAELLITKGKFLLFVRYRRKALSVYIGNTTEAEKLLQKALAKFPTSLLLHLKYLEVLEGLKNHQR
jgi:hypothetical protein